MDGFFVAKLKVGRPQKGPKKAGTAEEGEKKLDVVDNAMDIDKTNFNEEEDRKYIEGPFKLLIFFQSNFLEKSVQKTYGNK